MRKILKKNNLIRFFISFLILSATAFFPALAASDCSSIMDKKCDWEKHLVIADDTQVKITIPQKQIINFDCPEGKCECEEIAGSVELKGLEAINKQEKERSKNYRCSSAKVYARHRPQFVYASSMVFSIVTYNLNYIRDITKSCHGEHNFITYDTESGNRYLLKNILLEDKINALSDALIDDFLIHYVKQDADKEKDIRKTVREYIEKNTLKNSGFVVENGKVYLNIGAFIFGCAAGSFYPVEIPEQFISPEFLNKIKKKK